jgi:hypothetical protein
VEHTSVPDHIDILGKLASGAQLNMTVSNVTVGENYFELQGTGGVLKLSLVRLDSQSPHSNLATADRARAIQQLTFLRDCRRPGR